MNMKLSTIKLKTWVCILIIGCKFQHTHAQESYIAYDNHDYFEAEQYMRPYDKRLHRYRQNWQKLIPTHMKVQYAGNMGLMSFGTGWDYGRRNQWETDVFFGFIPKYQSKKAKATFTMKQNYIPWSLPLSERFYIEPLTCGTYLNTVFGSEFWVKQPDRYPKGYYGFTNKIRIHIFMGQRITLYNNPDKRYFAKAVSLFYEINTCDFYLISAITNSYLRPRDYLGLSFGAKIQIF